MAKSIKCVIPEQIKSNRYIDILAQSLEDIGMVYPILIRKMDEERAKMYLEESDHLLRESFHQVVENRISKIPDFKRRPECPRCYDCPLGWKKGGADETDNNDKR